MFWPRIKDPNYNSFIDTATPWQVIMTLLLCYMPLDIQYYRYGKIPSHQRKSLKQVSCSLLSGDGNSSISIRPSQGVNSKALQHPVRKEVFNKQFFTKIFWNMRTQKKFLNYNTLLSSTNSTSWGVFLRLRSANSWIWTWHINFMQGKRGKRDLHQSLLQVNFIWGYDKVNN